MDRYRMSGEIDSAFVNRVYGIVAEIPRGKVASYGQIAEKAGDPQAARDVGYIMSQVPPGSALPCHRVVNRTGTLAPDYVFGGKKRQRAMLEAEGITFLQDGRINMERHQWGEYEQLMLPL
ncbi:methylated-DNA--[protein]-cysteine S-methyltransferase [Clostridium sp. MCC353]|uniref:MGMT family protein n=1 Tax=Clostridium sp. MCC353 TaxID=2592646 RepID=UPI00207928EB|nr:MGMT family protein [Clostridium sp. MCC353]MBT9775312.1 methylated-DNA--[protein]-cysteine S-methyltransferase [Clostridium sp. MCC353]